MSEKSGLFSRLREYLGFETEPEKDKGEPTVAPSEETLSPKEDERDGSHDEPKKVKEIISEQRQEVKEILDHIIVPEERTLRNYMSMKFWSRKRDEYRKIKEKEKEDLNVYKVLSEGARPTIEYYILTILSCIIATNGLIVGSTAIIIGAMIVAPLMTPILAFSLGVIWGDLRLMRTSLESILKGAAVAVLISAVIALFVPEISYSPEIIARTKPTLYDIIVAIASGLVGAYGYANKKISSALVGIAIAVALMPPLCTIGIGLGSFDMDVTVGATMLFVINLVAISLAGAVVFWAMEIHPIHADEEEVKRRALFEIVASVIILAAIAIPIGFFMVEAYSVGKAKSNVEQTLIEELPGTSIFDMKTEKIESGYKIDITLVGDTVPDQFQIKDIESKILGENDSIGKIQIRFIESKILDK